MLNLIIKVYSTLQREGFQSVKKKSLNRYRSWKQIRKIDIKAQQIHWEQLKNKYLGKRVFLIGNGPSLNKTPLYLLKNEYKMCFNRFHIMVERLNWYPDFFLTSDNLVLSDLVAEFDEIIPKTTYSFFPGIHFRGENFIHDIERFDHAFWTIQLTGKGFSNQLPEIYPGGSVIYEGLQILKFLGFKEVYLVGVDMNYKIHQTAKLIVENGLDIISQDDDDPNHFDPRYFGKNRKYHQPEKFVIDNMLKDLDFIARKVMNKDFKIVNIGYDSKLDSFQKKEFLETLNLSESIKKELFYKLLTDVMRHEGVLQTAELFDNLEDGALFHIQLDSFTCELSVALHIMDKAIFSHLPLGPFENNYYFIKRKDQES